MGSYLASIYQYIYLVIVAIITFAYISRYKSPTFKPSTSNGGELLLVIAMILFFGLRPISGHFVDMSAYAFNLDRLRGETFWFTWDTDNKIFDNLLMWWGANGFDKQLFFLMMATIYMGCAYIGIKRLFSNHAFLAFVVFLAGFSTFSYGTNGIKAGAAASIFIMALGYWDKLYVCIPLMLVSLGFHHSMIMPIAAFVVTVFFKNPKWFYIGWFVCFIMALLHITYFQFLFGSMADEQGAGYLMATEQTSEAHIGFRPDFVLYSAMPVVIGYLFEMKRKVRLSKTYITLMHFYLMTNSIWMLCMYASFNNRIAYLSWFVYPLVIIYPFVDVYNKDVNKNKKLRKAVIYHLAFTMFMVFVYYGIFSFGR